MLLENEYLKYLFQQYLKERASDTELEELFAYIRESKREELLKKQIIEVYREIRTKETLDQVEWDAMFFKITGKAAVGIKEPKRKRLTAWARVAVAVFVLTITSIAGYRYFKPPATVTSPVVLKDVHNDIPSGGNKAVLILANGSEILLDSANNGKLASQGNMNVVKVNNGQLAYNAVDSKDDIVTPAYNTLMTPRGGQYQLILPDNSKVWLNAASSIRYPIVFTGKERRVELTGEAYFEVVHNEKKPFRIQVGKQLIEDLGTQFNINAYADEPEMKTTLLEGAVKVGNITLKPGEQAHVNKNGQITIVKAINIGDAVAWKNGFFAFREDDLKTVMRQLSRWYDVKIVYSPGTNKGQRFSGRIDRNLTLSQVLRGLTQTKANFTIEADRKVIILP